MSLCICIENYYILMSKQIKEHVSAGNGNYFALQNTFKSENVRRALEVIMYKTILRLVVTYESEMWIPMAR